MTTNVIDRKPPADAPSVSTTDFRIALGRTKLYAAIAIFAMVVGGASVLGGIFGAAYTWNQAAVQNITTPDDAVIAEAPVRGPLTMWSQADIITHHQLDRTDGQYYAEMDRQVPAIDEDGNVILDENGEPVMVPNEARASWLTATTLTNALNLGIMAYVLSAFAFVVGLTLLLLGWTVLKMRDAPVALA